jgi:hypothetical protein
MTKFRYFNIVHHINEQAFGILLKLQDCVTNKPSCRKYLFRSTSILHVTNERNWNGDSTCKKNCPCSGKKFRNFLLLLLHQKPNKRTFRFVKLSLRQQAIFFPIRLSSLLVKIKWRGRSEIFFDQVENESRSFKHIVLLTRRSSDSRPGCLSCDVAHTFGICSRNVTLITYSHLLI